MAKYPIVYYTDIQYRLLLFIVRLRILPADHITAAPAGEGAPANSAHKSLLCTFNFQHTIPFSVACS